IHSHRVYAIFFYEVIRIDHISFRFGHFFHFTGSFAPLANHPLVEQALKRLIKVDVSLIIENLGKKTGIKKVKNGVFDPSHVHVH
ncbi:unnamed protein product, partial [marine sediment metagenome]